VVQYGIRGNPHRMIQPLIASNDGALVTGDLQSGFDLPETQRAFEFLHQIYQVEGLGHPITDEWSDLIGEGGVPTAFFVTEMWTLGWGPRGEVIEHVAGVPFPTGPNNRSGNTSMARLQHAPMVPRGVENPYEVYRMIAEMRYFFRFYSEEAYESEIGEAPVQSFLNATREGWVHNLFGTAEDADRVLYGLEQLGGFDIGSAIDEIVSMAGSIAGQIMMGEGLPAPLLEAHRQQAQDVINTQFGN